MLDPLIGGALITGAAGLASSALGAVMQNRTNETSIELANSAHQREVADLRKAGLNPILSATGGHGSSTPSLGAPSVDLGGPVNSALASRLMKAQEMKTLAEASSAQTAAKLNDQTYWFNYHNAEGDAALKLAQVYKSDVDTDTKVLRAYKQSLMDQYDVAHSAAQAARLELPELRANAQFYQGLGKAAPYLKMLSSGISSAAGLNNLRLRTGH